MAPSNKQTKRQTNLFHRVSHIPMCQVSAGMKFRLLGLGPPMSPSGLHSLDRFYMLLHRKVKLVSFLRFPYGLLLLATISSPIAEQGAWRDIPKAGTDVCVHEMKRGNVPRVPLATLSFI